MIIYYLAFNMGLLSSLHCIGMCGPLSILSFSNSNSNSSKAAQVTKVITYQLGRTISYMFLGLIFGLLGQAFGLVGLQKFLTLTMGLLLIAVAIFAINVDLLMGKTRIFSKINASIMAALSDYYKKFGSGSAMVVGMLNGLVPCGIVYFALATATAAESLSESIMYMMFFGLGTLPLMSLFTIFGNRLKSKFNFSYQRILPWFAFFAGAFLLWRGFAIEVPTDLSLLLSMKNPVMCH